MSEIDNGIKQPLRFYDSIAVQNWRRRWVLTGLDKQATVISPANSILPFQIRRKSIPDVLVTFDAYKYDSAAGDFIYYVDLFTLIPGTLSDHLRVVQMTTVDNIIWNPLSAFTSSLDCGFYYVHLSDGVNDWYSEVFFADTEFTVNTDYNLSVFRHPTVVNVHHLITGSNDYLVVSNKIF